MHYRGSGRWEMVFGPPWFPPLFKPPSSPSRPRPTPSRPLRGLFTPPPKSPPHPSKLRGAPCQDLSTPFVHALSMRRVSPPPYPAQLCCDLCTSPIPLFCRTSNSLVISLPFPDSGDSWPSESRGQYPSDSMADWLLLLKHLTVSRPRLQMVD